MNVRTQVLKAREALLNSSNKLSYFEDRRLTRTTIAQAFVGYEPEVYFPENNGQSFKGPALVYPCVGGGRVLGVHYKSEEHNKKGKRRQKWSGYADDLPRKGHGKRPEDPAKIIPFGLETLEGLEPGSLVVLCCGEEDALSLRSVGHIALSQPGAGLLEPVYARMLAGFDVVVAYDAGEQEEAYKDALKLERAGARRVRVVEWPPDAPHGSDVNGKLVKDPEGFKDWASRMISEAKPLTSDPPEYSSNVARAGKPDAYRDFPGGRDDEGGWEDPVPLPEGLPAVAAFDTTMLPDPLRSRIEYTSERMQIPPDFLAAGAMVVASSLVGRKFGIYPKRWDDWLVVPNLWGIVVARPALLKSPALGEVMKPLDRLVAEARDRFDAEMASYEVEVAVAEAEQGALKDALKRAAKGAEKSGDRAELEEVARKQRASQEGAPEMPVLRKYKSEDPTVEKLGEVLIENPQGILVHRDEASGWLGNLKKQGREGDRSFYMEGWNGSGSYEVDRIGRGSLYIPAVCLSFLGGIQPGPLSSYVWEATHGGSGDDGLLQRFQLLVWPDPSSRWSNVDRRPDAESKRRAYEVFRKLDSLSAEEFGATSADEDSIPAVRFTPQAQSHFDAFREELEARLLSGDLSPHLEAHLAKYRSLMPSLALLFAAVDYVDGEAEPGAVGAESALRAWAWCEYLESHARRLYAAAEDPDLERARALLKRIRSGDVEDGATARSVYRHQWSRLTTPKEVAGALDVLEAYGWVRVEITKTGGRPTARIRLHPTLIGGRVS
jgi:hypothetical protein